MNPQGTEGVPSFHPAKTRETTRGEGCTYLMEQVVERNNMFHALHRVFKDKIRQLTCRSKSQSMKDRINNLNTYMVGWMGYLYLLN